MNRQLSPPPPADASTSTPPFFAEDDSDSDDVHNDLTLDHLDHLDRLDHLDHFDTERRMSQESQSSVSTTSVILERISDRAEVESSANTSRKASPHGQQQQPRRGPSQTRRSPARRKMEGDDIDMRDLSRRQDDQRDHHDRLSDFDEEDPLKGEHGDECDDDYDLETGPFLGAGGTTRSNAGAGNNTDDDPGHPPYKPGSRYAKMDPSLRRIVLIVAAVVAAAWVGGLVVYISRKAYLHGSTFDYDTLTTASGHGGTLRKITRDQVDGGFFRPRRASIEWVAGPDGEDGLLLETSRSGKAYLTVEDVRSMDKAAAAAAGGPAVAASRTLVQAPVFTYGTTRYSISTATPSRNMAKVLLAVDRKSNWRHSATAAYFIMDVATQAVEPLVPAEPEARVQLALWSPASDAVSFTREDNNLYVRRVPADVRQLAASPVVAVTTDGGAELFYGVPDWVYEEEVFSGPSAAWWSPDGHYVAFLRTNETGVPDYPVEYFIERPSGTTPRPGEENYPEVRQIKYPKAGAHNPVVELMFYELGNSSVFSVPVSGGFADADRLITTVLWAGAHKVLVKETNRISDVMRVVVVDVAARTGAAVRTMDVGKIDGGWFEISTTTQYVPADAARGRPDDGYIDTVVHNNGDHLAYFSPPENPEPVMLTTGPGWEVVDAPAGVDLARNLVYFVATKDGSTQRHVYSVRLQDGGGLAAVTNTSAAGVYEPSFSAGAGYLLLEYQGPGIPWQKVLAMAPPAETTTPFQHTLEDNAQLAERARTYALPQNVYGTLDLGTDAAGERVVLNYVERRPPHFDAAKQYPVLFQQYSGPGSQQVQQAFRVDFQSYVAASLGYLVVTVDPRGTGFLGRHHRVVVRGQLGVIEAHDHVAAAAHWAGLPYVDAARLALWGWSYGGFTTLKTLEVDAGRTFRYGVAVAPVTDWRFYDSIYTERYMDTPQRNGVGYEASTVANATALAQNVRFMVMHGIADDNVHLQNTLALLDRLDVAGVSNYDVHVFPDSDHSIYFHNGNKIVYDSECPLVPVILSSRAPFGRPSLVL